MWSMIIIERYWEIYLLLYQCKLSENKTKYDQIIKENTSVKPAKPNQQNQTKPIKLFSTYFVLIFTTNNNFVLCAILEKTVTLPP